MARRHEKRAALARNNPLSTETETTKEPSSFESIVLENPRSDTELLAIFDAAVYRALLVEQQKVTAFLAGDRHVHSR